RLAGRGKENRPGLTVPDSLPDQFPELLPDGDATWFPGLAGGLMIPQDDCIRRPVDVGNGGAAQLAGTRPALAAGRIDQPEFRGRFGQDDFSLDGCRHTVALTNARFLQLPEHRPFEELVFQGEFLEPLKGHGVVVAGTVRHALRGPGETDVGAGAKAQSRACDS